MPPRRLLALLAVGILLLLPAAVFLPGTPVDAKPAVTWQDVAPPGYRAFPLKYVSRGDFLGLLRGLDIGVDATRFLDRGVLLIRFPDQKAEKRAVQLYEKIDVFPRKIGLQFQLILASDAPQKGLRAVSDGDLLKRLRRVRPAASYQVLDDPYLALSSRQKANVFLAGTYKATLKAVFINDGKGDAIRLGGLTVRSLDPAFKVKGLEDSEPDWDKRQPNGLRKDDTRLLKTTLSLRNGETVLVGSWEIDRPHAAVVAVVTASLVH